MTLNDLIHGRKAQLVPTKAEEKQGIGVRDCEVLGASSSSHGGLILLVNIFGDGVQSVAAYRVDFLTELDRIKERMRERAGESK